jgi:ABC-2 type transport system ATP-binding protein
MESILRINNLMAFYPARFGKKKLALDNLGLEVKKGEIFGLLGPNGAGKTTMIKAVIGLLNPQGGEISLFGNKSSAVSDRLKIGFLPEISTYYWFFTPAELLKMYGGLCGMGGAELARRIDYVLSLVGLSAEKKQLIRTFSKGMQQRMGFAQALLHNPEFLILDEPFSGLDPVGRVQIREILKELKKENKTILLSSHELSEAELICDHICIMKNGRALKSGAMEELLKELGEETLEKYFLEVLK